MPNPSPAAATDDEVAAILVAMDHEPGDWPWSVNSIDDVDNLAYTADSCGVEWMRGVCVWDTSDQDSADCLITYDLPDEGLRLSSLTISLKHFISPPGTDSESAVRAALQAIKSERDAMVAALQAWLAVVRP